MRPEDLRAIGDFHSHLVPGVDDGARTLDDALEGVERMVAAGIRKIITTPHLDGSLTLDPQAFAERMAQMDGAWETIVRAVDERFPEVDFRRGHELMLDVPDPDLGDPRIRLGGSSFVLVEWPRLQLPPGTTDVIRRLRHSGVRPVIAHPERYVGFDRGLDLVREWRRAGAFLQMNYGSLVGRYGPEARELSFRLLRRGWADYLSTDFHGRPHLKLLRREAVAKLAELGADEQVTLLTVTNPQRIFRDEEPLPVPALLTQPNLWSRLRELLHLEHS
jgi:protein-tyrosine phosphatase